jgi:hypothetical protein
VKKSSKWQVIQSVVNGSWSGLAKFCIAVLAVGVAGSIGAVIILLVMRS